MTERPQGQSKAVARYAAAAVLLLSACRLGGADDSRLKEDTAYAGSIRVSLAHPADVETNDYQLLFAASSTATALGVCELKSRSAKKPPAKCQVNGTGYIGIDLIASSGGRNFFMANRAILDDGLTLMIVASDGTGRVVDSRTVVFKKADGAGQSDAGTSGDAGAQGDSAAPSDADASSKPAAAAGLTDEEGLAKTVASCASVACHDHGKDFPKGTADEAKKVIRSRPDMLEMLESSSDAEALAAWSGVTSDNASDDGTPPGDAKAPADGGESDEAPPPPPDDGASADGDAAASGGG